jgi:hypothetical protein
MLCQLKISLSNLYSSHNAVSFTVEVIRITGYVCFGGFAACKDERLGRTCKIGSKYEATKFRYGYNKIQPNCS